ncbi:MAG TPA: 30S ribosomal protein S6, partial [Chloroflexota bacterium]|nr:30S ribosomal protein S6 [Chloroflexota bacterium]
PSHWPGNEARAIPKKGGAIMRNYELMTIFRPDLEEEALQAAVERLNSLITARQGEVSSNDPWGRRRMAYSINDFRDGIYNVTQLKLDPKASDDLERALQLNDQIIRYMLVRQD